MVDESNESTPDQPFVHSIVGNLFGGGGAPAPLPLSSERRRRTHQGGAPKERAAAPERPVNLRASSKGIGERATVPAAEEEEDRAFLAKVASMKYAFGKPKPNDASAPVVTNAVGATSAAEPTLLSKLAASAPKLQPPPFLSKRSDAQPNAAGAAAAPEYATKPRSSSLIERMLDSEMARASPKPKPKPKPKPMPKPKPKPKPNP